MIAAEILDFLLSLFALYVLLKFLVFFCLRYDRLRAMLDKAYAKKTSATKRQDVFLFAACTSMVVLLYLRGVEHRSFLAGLLVGMTLIQLYFHEFSDTLSDREKPADPESPIKTMSYAIQANPGRAWKELLFIAALVLASGSRILGL